MKIKHLWNRSEDRSLEILLGEPKAAIRSMVLPFLIAMAVIEINQFVDTFWISGLGASSAEAVSTAVPIYGLMTCAGLGIGTGATTAIAFRLGRSEINEARLLASNSLILGLICAIISSVVTALLLDPALTLMGADSVRTESVQYIIPYILMSPAIILNSVVGGMLRGEGAARKSTTIQLSSAILNMVIDPILIYVCGLGVFGAGLSTTVSALIALCIGLNWYVKGKTVVGIGRSTFRYDSAMSREVLGVGGPKTIQSLISNMTDLVQRVFLIVAGGTTGVMLYNYSWRYIALVNLPGRAFESAMVPVCSAAMGQEDMSKMREGFVYTIKLALTSSILLSLMLYVFAEPLMSIMTYEESMSQILPYFVWTMQVSVLLIPFSALMGAGSSMLQSMKKAKMSMYFYFLWGFIKLGLYALSAYGLLGVDPFKGIIYCMVIVHVFGGIALMVMAWREFSKLKKGVQSHGVS